MFELTERKAKCLICGYEKVLRDHDSIPERCPVCRDGENKTYTLCKDGGDDYDPPILSSCRS